MTDDELVSRRTYLELKAMQEHAPADFGLAGVFLAIEAVASTAIEHPEWDMDERRTWAEWEAESDGVLDGPATD